ncbi:MAG: DUF2029 domain-containing protein, partial [Chloroflexi bacterium]|nr:DUF2029 domain-containing protein [Chloroflexota bacterium]
MKQTRGRWQGLLAAVLVAAVIGLLTWVNVRFAYQNPGGNDFLTRWVGTRALLFEGLSPYSDEVALRIQQRAYGRPARADEDQMRMAYPIYSVLIFAPFAWIADYPLARAVWMTALEVLLLALLALSLRLVRWKPSTPLLGMLLLFSLTWYHGVRAVINGNAVVWVAFFLTAAVWALEERRDAWAGVLLALATIKPHLALLPLLFVFGWAWFQHRRKVIVWTVGTVAVFSLAGMLVVPQWVLQNLREVLAYTDYTPPTTIQDALQGWFPEWGTTLGWALTLALAGMLVWVWWQAWQQVAFPLWTYALTLVASQWIGITTDPGNFILLFLPLIWVLARLARRFGERAAWVLLGV